MNLSPRLRPFLITVSAWRMLCLRHCQAFFRSPPGTTSNPAVEFYNKFHRAADDHDRDFIKKYDEDLNSTLIFVSIFSMHFDSRMNPTLGIGRFVLRSNIHFYYRCSK